MDGTSFRPSGEELRLLSQIIRKTARLRQLSPGHARDFARAVRRRFVEQRYGVFRRVQDHAALEVRLTTLVNRMFFDWRRAADRQRHAASAAVSQALRAALLRASDDDRRRLRMRCFRDRRVRAAAPASAADTRALSQRFDRLLRELRVLLGNAGTARSDPPRDPE